MAKKNKKNASSQLTNQRVTIYPSYALVQGTYELKLNKGQNKVRLEGLPTQYDPDSLHVLSFQGPGEVTLGPSAYRGANLHAQTMQAKHINHKVTVRFGGNLAEEQQTLRGTLLSLNGNQALLELKGGEVREVRNVVGFEYDEVPEGLSNRPSLTLTVEASAKGKYCAVILYKALGFGWSAGYKWIHDDKAGKITIDGSVFTTNASGACYENASLKVVAGDAGAEEIQEAMPFRAAAALSADAPIGGAMAKSRRVNNARSENLGQVKVFAVPGQVTLEEGERQKVPFFSAEGVAVDVEYHVGCQHGWHYNRGDKQEQDVRTNLLFKNDEASGLGKALPGGFVQVMQADSEGTLLKSGGGNLEDVAVGEDVKLDIGSDFDVKAWRVVEDVKKEPARKPAEKTAPLPEPAICEGSGPAIEPAVVEQPGKKSKKAKPKKFYYYKHCKVELFNGKDRPVEFVVHEQVAEDHKLMDGKHGLTQTTAGRFEQRVVVAPNATEEVRYVLRQEQVEEVVDE